MGTLAALVIVLLGVEHFSGIFAPMFLTISLVIAAYPLLPWLIHLGVPRTLSAVMFAIIVFAILGAFFLMMVWAIAALIAELPQYQNQFMDLYREVVKWLASTGITGDEVAKALSSVNPASVAGVLQSALSSVSGVVSIAVVIVMMIFMMAMDSGTFASRNQALERSQHRVWQSMVDYVQGVRRYWLVTSVFGLIVAVVDTLALFIMGVPLALVWGVLSFITNYIPNIGFVIGLVPPVLMALLAKGPVSALIVILVYSGINFVIQSVIQPKFNGDAVGVTATVAFLSLLVWSAVLGPLGALLALPMTLLAKALFVDPDPNLRWLNAFISNDPRNAGPRAKDPALPS